MKVALARSLGALAAGVMLAAPLSGQTAGGPKHEFGVDLGIAYSNIASPVSGGSSVSVVQLTTPVDVRVGFLAPGPLSWELRFVGSFQNESSGGFSLTIYSFMPDVNLIYRLGAGAGQRQLLGPYLTAGLGARVTGESSSGGGGSNSGLNVPINLGLGTRTALGSGAFRGELYLAFTPKNGNIGPDGNEITLGVRAGISLWH